MDDEDHGFGARMQVQLLQVDRKKDQKKEKSGAPSILAFRIA